MKLPASLRLFEGAPWTLAASCALAVVQSVLLVPIAIATRRVFDTLIPDGRTTSLALTGLLIIGLYLASAAVALATRYIVQRAVKQGIARYRAQLLARLLALPQAYFDRVEIGFVHASVVQDTERVDCMASSLASDLLPSTIVAVVLIATLIYLNALLSFVVLAVVPVVTIAAKLLGRQVRIHGARWQTAFDVFSARTLLTLRALPLTRIHSSEAPTLEAREVEIAELSRTGLAVTWRSTAYSLAQGTIATAAGIAVLIVGGGAVARHDMSIGDLLSFYTVVALLLRQVGTATNSVPIVIIGRTSLRRLDALTADAPPPPYRGSRAHRFEGALSVDDAWFGYADESPVLRGVSLSIERGEHVVIMGPNGAGKSTLLRLVLALYRPDTGTLRADGVPYDELDVAALRSQMGVVLQEPIMLPGTIAENIAFGRAGYGDKEIRRAAAAATADRFIETLPNGYDTWAGEDGGLLSGGQRQRIAIARALLGDPALVLLDEPSTHLDDRSIADLLTGLRELPGAPTVVLITHDPSVAAAADRIHQLRDGVVVGADLPLGTLAG